MGLLSQNSADIFKFAVFLLNGMRNKQLLQFCLLCQKREQSKNLQKYSLNLTLSLWRKRERKPKLVCVVKKSKELWFAVLDKTCAKQRAQLCWCLKLAPSHTEQLWFCFKLARIVKDLKLAQKTVRNCPVAWNWLQNILRNCCFAWDWRLVLKS